MSPADGSTCPEAGQSLELEARLALILPGGRSLIALMAPGPLPAEGTLGAGIRWQAEAWPTTGGWAGLALTSAAVTERATLRSADGPGLRLHPPRRLEVRPEALAEFVRDAGLNPRDALAFLLRVLPLDQDDASNRSFMAAFIAAAAGADGFVEILAIPDSGGLFAQGWAMSLVPGRLRLAKLDGDLTFCEAEVTAFTREDILPPGQGFALFSRDWRDQDLSALQALVFEHEGSLRRLEVVRGSVLRLEAATATAHVAAMLPRLTGPDPSLRAMRRICRPRYAGEDSLSTTGLPVAAALDAVFQAPDGGILAMGWLLDPLARVERVILKSRANLYAPLQDRWHSVPRPDLVDGFEGDPRFARLLDRNDAMHGFIAYAPGRCEAVEGSEVYLELVMADNSCLFRPVTVTPLASRDRLPGILAPVSPHDPALGALVETVLAPFLKGLPATPPRAAARRTAMLALGAPAAPRDIAAIMPFRTLAQLQPVFALLAGTPEAAALDLTLVCPRGGAPDLAERLEEAFHFYGLSGRLLLVPERESLLARFEAGIAATRGSRLLLWEPSVLPAGPNWLARLVREAQWVRPPGLISPRLVYEDGSICFGGGGDEGPQGGCPQLGYPADWMAQGRPMRAGAGAPEIALVGRAELEAAGGLSGRLFSERLAHRDLADRLQAAGAGTWCSGSVTFWALEEAQSDANDSFTALMAKVDGALIAARSRERSAS